MHARGIFDVDYLLNHSNRDDMKSVQVALMFVQLSTNVHKKKVTHHINFLYQFVRRIRTWMWFSLFDVTCHHLGPTNLWLDDINIKRKPLVNSFGTQSSQYKLKSQPHEGSLLMMRSTCCIQFGCVWLVVCQPGRRHNQHANLKRHSGSNLRCAIHWARHFQVMEMTEPTKSEYLI